MPYRLLYLALLPLALAGCQSPNPYVASSRPLPPAPAWVTWPCGWPNVATR